jgi:hypothetical protein
LKYFPIYSELLQNYINGLFYSTVVLSGVLCERICFDILSLESIEVKGTKLTEKQISFLYEMNLSRILELLYSWKLIEKETRDDMFRVYEKRNSYTHPKMKAINPKKDAPEVFKRVKRILINEFVRKRQS